MIVYDPSAGSTLVSRPTHAAASPPASGVSHEKPTVLS